MIIKPVKYLSRVYEIPGDKSITHRAIMFNSAAEGNATIVNALVGEDCLSTMECMRALGAKIERDGNTFYIEGVTKFNDNVICDCGNSGTTMRLLCGLIAGKNVNATLTGDASLSSRPMNRVASPLSLLGATIETTNGKAPLKIISSQLKGANINTLVASAQVKSALILAGLGADGETVITEPIKSRDHTERMLAAMGADIKVEKNTIRVKKSSLKAVDVDVPADISSAAYFMAIGALTGKTMSKRVGINPTRTGILKAFDLLNVKYRLENEQLVCGEPVADVVVEKSDMKGIKLSSEIMPSLIDELPIIAILCAFAEGESVISGAEELKVKESNRIKTTVEMINNLGGDATATDDGFIIKGKKSLKGGKVNSYGDHRIAMSAAIGLSASENGGEIIDAECVNISFPNFYKMLANN